MSAPTIPGFDDLQEIGRGGFGVVYRAPQEGFGRHVAIKVLTPTGNLDERARRRFERETATTGQLSGHPHIVTLHQAGFTEDERPYLVMAFHERGSLRDLVDREGPLEWPKATAIGIQLAGALATAHAAGVVHRDVKPDNVLLDDFGAPVLTDFGIASVSGPDLATVTSTGQMTMTLAFSPPEVLEGARPEQRTDVFSLGATLFALLTGNPPFVRPDDESLAPVLARMMREDAPDLTEHGVPGPVAACIARALERDPARRTPSAVALGQQLQDAQRALDLPVTEMVLPRELELGGERERTLALPNLDLPGVPLETPDPTVARATTSPLGGTPASTPTESLGASGATGDQVAVGGPRTPTLPVGPQATPPPQDWAGWNTGSGRATTSPPAEPRRRGGTARAGLVGALVGVVLLAAIGIGYVLATGDDEPPPPPPTPATSGPTASEPGIPPAPPPPDGPPTTPTASTLPTAPPTSAPPTGGPDPAPDVAVTTNHPEAPEVARTLQQWHDGINTGDYGGAFATYTGALQGRVTFERFRDGNSTSVILAPQVLEVQGGGDQVVATIAFRSLQDPSLGPDGQDCSDWTLEWRMTRTDGPLRWLVDDVDAVGGSPFAC